MAERIEDNQEKFIKDAVQQFVNAQMEGQEPDIDGFVKKYPDCAHQIKQMVLNIHKIDTLFDSLVKTDESDFEVITDEYDLVGQKVGNFEIVEIIGRGGMGVVYLARDTKLKRSVAIKSMPYKFQADSTARSRFRREAELLASLNHPNIAVIHDIVEQDGDSGYLVLEYIEGQTLSQRLAHKPIELTEALSIGQQIVEAVSAAHKKGIVHRDLKPGNIKITPEGRVKVLDFGLAKPSTSETKTDDVTTTEIGRVVGTPAYMSPEQAQGKETDHRTDIWSFGCIMYQMLTGRLPYEGETATDTLARIIEHQPDWELLPQEIPAKIRALLHRCLEKDPDRRLRDITEAMLEIKETLSKPLITTHAKLRRMIKIISVVTIGVILSGVAWKFIAQKGVQTSQKQVFYLRGNEYFYRGYMEDDLRNAIQLYNSAIELDPNFALAYTQLARAHSRIYWFRYDRSEDQVARTKKAVDKAFELDPDLPEAHLALGQYYYHCHLDYDRALEQFDIARKGRPDDGEPLSMISFVKRQQGKYDEALDYIKKAYELNPISNSIATEAGTTFFHMHMYEDAERCYERAISLAPDIHHNYFFKAKLYLSWQGDTKKAREVIEEAMQNARGAEYPFIVNLLVNIEIYDENYQEGLKLLSKWPSESFDTGFFFISKALLQAQINGLMGNDQLEQSYYQSARSILESKITEHPEDPRVHGSLGIAYAGIGLREEAITEGLQGHWLDLARIYCMVEKYDLAIDKLAVLLDVPGELSIPWIKLDPAWNPLRNHPRFKKLVDSDN
jgi:serine/threonine protein kinase/Flp pilus assembly protein TadD